MKKLLAILFAAVLLLCCSACRPGYLDAGAPGTTTPSVVTDPSTEPPPSSLPQETFGPQPNGGIFHLDNIVRITFFSYYGQGTGSNVPAENMQEIIDWLATYTLGDPASTPLPPGTDTVYVEIEYNYGAIFRTGMNTVDFAGTIYYIHGSEAPECYSEILKGTSLP